MTSLPDWFADLGDEWDINDAFNHVEGIFDMHVEALMDHIQETASTMWDCRYNEHGNPEVWLA